MSFDSFVQPEQVQQLSQLSGLVDLQHIELPYISNGVSGGLPSQLVKLTCLHMGYRRIAAAEQFQHLSSLTALQVLDLKWFDQNDQQAANLFGEIVMAQQPGNLLGIQHLVQLTSLRLQSMTLRCSTLSLQAWTSLTALQSLALSECAVQPRALAALRQLQVLSLVDVKPWGAATFEDLIRDVSQLPLLAEFAFSRPCYVGQVGMVLAPSTLTALQASTNLRSLQLGLDRRAAPQGCNMFMPGAMFPHVRKLDLTYKSTEPVRATEQQLQQVCSCCPALESLVFHLCEDVSPDACLPLLQLTARTSLQMAAEHCASEAASAVILAVAAQLTGLKQLHLRGLSHLKNPSILQLTALTALEELDSREGCWGHTDDCDLDFRSTVSHPCWTQGGTLCKPIMSYDTTFWSTSLNHSTIEVNAVGYVEHIHVMTSTSVK